MSSTSRERNNSNKGIKFFKKNFSVKNPKKAKELLLNIKQKASGKLFKKYQTDENTLNQKIVNDIIYNEKAHIVAVFKDYLILDDTSEFLKRFYKVTESKQRLPRIFEFYDSFSKIFANYIILSESKYLYKNIQRKQKMIDNLQKLQNDLENGIDKDNDYIFNTEIYNSIMNQTPQLEDTAVTTLGNKIRLNTLKNNQIDLNASIDSIELLIDSIGKAEKVSGTTIPEYNFNTIYSNTSDGPVHKIPVQSNNKFHAREINKLHSPNPSVTNTNSLMYNSGISNKQKLISIITENKKPSNNKVFQPEQRKAGLIGTINLNNLPVNTNKKNNVVEKFEKIIVVNRGEKTDRLHERNTKQQLNMMISNVNSNHNTIIATSSSGLNTISATTNNKMIPSNLTIRTGGIAGHNRPDKENTNKQKLHHQKEDVKVIKEDTQGHKSNSSMPKLSYQVNNYQTTTTIDKNLIKNLGNHTKNKKTLTLETKNTSTIPCNSKNYNLISPPDSKPSIKTLSNKPSNDEIFNKRTKNLNTIEISNSINRDLNKYIKTYTSDISKIKKKVSSLVNESTNSNNKKIFNHGTPNNFINSMNKDIRTNPLNARDEGIPNSIRSILQREIFEGEVQIDRIYKKNLVGNTKVYPRAESIIRDKIISRNSCDVLELKNSKERTIPFNTSNSLVRNYSVLNLTDRRLEHSRPNTNLSSPKKIFAIEHNENNLLKNSNTHESHLYGKKEKEVFLSNKNLTSINPNISDSKSINHLKKLTTNHGGVKSIAHHNNTYLSQKAYKYPNENKEIKNNFLEDRKLIIQPRKILESKIATNNVVNSLINSSNNNQINKMKIKNFYEVIKYGNIQTNSNSARTTYSTKTPLLVSNINNKNIKK